jgi:hypothetical protein
MDKSVILQRLIVHYTEGNKALFAQKIGVMPQTISSWLARKTFDIDLIFAKCESVSAEFLLTGKEPLMKDEHSKEEPSIDFGMMLDSYRTLACDYGRLQNEYERLRSELNYLKSSRRPRVTYKTVPPDPLIAAEPEEKYQAG